MAELEKTTSIEYEVTIEGSEEKVVSGKLNDNVLLTNKSEDVVSYEERADKTDVLIASASGILTGLLDEDDPAAKKLRNIHKVIIIGDFEVYKTFENN